jgi:hypothetical protein
VGMKSRRLKKGLRLHHLVMNIFFRV